MKLEEYPRAEMWLQWSKNEGEHYDDSSTLWIGFLARTRLPEQCSGTGYV